MANANTTIMEPVSPQWFKKWKSIRSAGQPGVPFPGNLPKIDDASGRRRFIWDIARFSDPDLTEPQMLSILSNATLSAYRWCACRGWIETTEQVVHFLVDMLLWSSMFPEITFPWSGSVDTGVLTSHSRCSKYNDWLKLNPDAISGQFYWSPVYPVDSARAIHVERFRNSLLKGYISGCADIRFSPRSSMSAVEDYTLFSSSQARIEDIGEVFQITRNPKETVIRGRMSKKA